MKKNIFHIALATASLTCFLPSCDSDYLDTKPETTVSSGDVISNVEAARMAVNGICKSMNCQYSETNYNQYSGEAFINTVFNDQLGPDYLGGLWMQSWSAEQMKWETMTNERWTGNNMVWGYCYNLIGQANNILSGIDNAEGDEGVKELVKAQALTFRAHGYIKLLQLFAPRWEDSNNGEAYCMPLRLEPGNGDIALSKMNDVLDQVYDDLTTAIGLYQSCGTTRKNGWEPDIDVARGLFARVALIKHDWAKAQTMAHDARQAHPVMSAQDYLNGFTYVNSDFMWHQDSEPSDTYYWAWGVNYSCNGNHIETWGIGGGSINIDLYKQLDENDMRTLAFFTPDKIYMVDDSDNPDNVTEADFWNEEWVNSANIMDCSGGIKLNEDGTGIVAAGLRPVCMGWIFYTANNVNKTFNSTPNAKYPYLMLYNTNSIPASQAGAYWQLNSAGTISGGPAVMPFGSQTKFWALDAYGTMPVPFMRGSEMCIVEAEAAYMAGDIPTAQSCLDELNSKRILGYQKTTLTGDALLEAIRLTRRIELWGEGQNFSDFKRWNIRAEKRKWVAGDVTSGNTPQEFAYDHDVNFANGWRFTVPSGESDYNRLIDRTLLP